MARMRSSRLLLLLMVCSHTFGRLRMARSEYGELPPSNRYSSSTPMAVSPPRDDFANCAGVMGGEEQPAIGNGDNGACAAAVEGNRIFTDHFAVRSHAADLVGNIFGKPEIAIGRHRDAAQGSIRGLHRPLGDMASGVDASERVGLGFDEPDVAVGVRGHGARFAVRGWNFVLAEMSIHADAADLARFVLAEPEIAVAHH